MRRCCPLAPAVAIALTLSGCRDERNPVAPTPPAFGQPVLIEQTGPVEITFVDAVPSLGSAVAG